jgi:threonine/homoserine/homoserine lactone efflux protein
MLTKTRERAASLLATIGCVVGGVVIIVLVTLGVFVLCNLMRVAGGWLIRVRR